MVIKPITLILAIVLVFYLFTLCAAKYSGDSAKTHQPQQANSYSLMDAMMWGH